MGTVAQLVEHRRHPKVVGSTPTLAHEQNERDKTSGLILQNEDRNGLATQTWLLGATKLAYSLHEIPITESRGESPFLIYKN